MLSALWGTLIPNARASVSRVVRGNLGRAVVDVLPEYGDHDNGAACDEGAPSPSSLNQIAPLHVGQVAHISRAFSEQDIEDFCLLTGDLNPVHLDSKNENCIVPGLLCASLIPAVFASRCPGVIYVSQELSFKSPLLVGQIATCSIKVESVKNLRGRIIAQCTSNVVVGDKSTDIVIKGSARVLLNP